MSEELRTRFALKSIDLAELFNILLGQPPLAGPVRFRTELSAPDGQSTGGGVQALQHIKLIPPDGGATLVAGWANHVEGTAELRTLAYLGRQHAQRFGRSTLAPPPSPAARLDPIHYAALLERIRAFFEEHGIRVKLVDAPEPPTAIRAGLERSARPAARPWPWLLLLALVLLTVVLLVR